METHRRKADGRRIFSPQFKQEQVARLSRQEVTPAELAPGAVGLAPVAPALAAPERGGEHGGGDRE